VQIVLLCLLLISFILMAQAISHTVFQVGAIILIVCGLIQIAVGNIDATYGIKRTLLAFLKIAAIIASVFIVSILLIPLFLKNEFVSIFLNVLIIGTVITFALFVIFGTKKKTKESR